MIFLSISIEVERGNLGVSPMIRIMHATHVTGSDQKPMRTPSLSLASVLPSMSHFHAFPGQTISVGLIRIKVRIFRQYTVGVTLVIHGRGHLVLLRLVPQASWTSIGGRILKGALQPPRSKRFPSLPSLAPNPPATLRKYTETQPQRNVTLSKASPAPFCPQEPPNLTIQKIIQSPSLQLRLMLMLWNLKAACLKIHSKALQRCSQTPVLMLQTHNGSHRTTYQVSPLRRFQSHYGSLVCQTMLFRCL